jgi:putative endonuclease
MSLGSQGEEIAVNYLNGKGYKIVDKNYRCRLGEIDIIAYKDNTLVFVEVKTRQNTSYGLPCESVTKTKQHHIMRTAAFYVLKNDVGDVNQRIDIIEILYREQKAYIRHLENAF